MPRLTLSLLAALCAALLLAACGGGGGATSGGGESTAVDGPTTSAEAPPKADGGEPSPGETGAGQSGGSGAGEGGGKKDSPPRTITEPREEETGVGVDESRRQAEAAIEKAIVASVTGTDPANCAEVEAPAFVEQTTGMSGSEALQACEQEAESSGGPKETVKVESVEAVGESAVADVAIGGGTLDGQTLEIALRREDGRWRLGKLIGFHHFDRDAFVATIGRAMSEGGGQVAAARRCVLKDLELLPSSEFEDSILDHSAPAITKAFEACQ